MTAETVPADRPMTWDEYAKLGDDVRGEYIDGKLVISPSPTRPHQQICHRLVNLLAAAIPADYEVTAAWSWKPRRDEFIPDVLVHPVTEEIVRFTGMPALAVEVVSTNRGDDPMLKIQKYAAVGLPHYWVVDPRDRFLSAFVLKDGLYARGIRVDDIDGSGEPVELSFGIGSVVVDLPALLGGRR